MLHRLKTGNEVIKLILIDKYMVNGFVWPSAINLDNGDERALMSQLDRLGLVVS